MAATNPHSRLARVRSALTTRRLGRRALLLTPALVLAVWGGWAGSAGTTPPVSAVHGTTAYDWQLTPAGRQLGLGDFPMNGVLSRDGRYLFVSNDGQGTQSLQVVRRADLKVVQTISYDPPNALFLGLALSRDGGTLYASGGGQNVIHVYSVSQSASSLTLTETAPIAMATAPNPSNPYPAGLTVTDRWLFVAENLAGGVSRIDRTTGAVTGFLPTGSSSGCSSAPSTPLDCPFPYTAALNLAGDRLFVSNWGQRSVSVVDPASMSLLANIPVGLHPNAIAVNPKTGKVYVSNTDSEQLSVLDGAGTRVERTIDLKPFSDLRDGTAPDSVAVSGDGSTAYVAAAGNNDVEVIDLNKGSVRGLIPTAWYPTTALLADSGRTLLVLNAKGLGAGPNPGYQQGTYGPPTQYVGSMMQGTLSSIGVPGPDQLEFDTAQVVRNDRFTRGGESEMSAANPIPQHRGQPSPIKHVIFVIKENRTYDQVFGDLGRGNGDPGLAMFGAKVTPNLHALARQFVTLDNFYADAEISAQGHNWSTGATSNDYTEKNWPANYANGPGRNRGYDFEGTNRATYPRAGFLWNDATRSNVPFRDYGEFESYNPATASWVPNDPSIGNRYDPQAAGYTFAVPDAVTPGATSTTTSRFDAWKSEFDGFVNNGGMPALEIMRMPNDHTRGTTPGALTPSAYVAQNDYAVGKLVDTVSHSPYWKDTAIFVTEDDAQDGPDHVDAHRTESLVISPYTQLGKVDSTRYDTVSMLRTMELILGMSPLSQYDAVATPMLASFSNHPEFHAYDVRNPQVSTTAVNTGASPMAAVSAAMDFSAEDRADMTQLNHVLWASTMGSRPYPVTGGARASSPPASVGGPTPGDG